MSAFAELYQRVVAFRDVRGWRPDHTLKDLASAIAIEAAELQEQFLWQSVVDEPTLLLRRRPEIESELADVLIHCINFAAVADIDIIAAAQRKLDVNEARFPLEARVSPRGVASGSERG